MVFCTVVAVVMLESRVESFKATYSAQCTQLATRLSNITTAITGQKTIGSETQCDLLMMGVKTPQNMLRHS
jgi:hypothetical protein